MADDKPFEATQSRLARARREGDIARSYELNALSAFAAAAIAVAVIASPLAGTVQALIQHSFNDRIPVQLLLRMAILTLTPVVVAACASAACALIQSGGFQMSSFAPKVERLSPNENFKRILSRETVISVARATLAFTFATIAIIPTFRSVVAAAFHGVAPAGLAHAAWSGSLHAAALACIAAGVFAGADYALQLQRWRRRLRMSHDELRRDRKEQDGDPVARSRRHLMHREIARGSLRRVKEAAFVICNPEHIAIALEYRPPVVPVPRVLVRAADEVAARVREIAKENCIPLVQNVELARALYEITAPNEFIPPQLYLAVAEIVANLNPEGDRS